MLAAYLVTGGTGTLGTALTLKLLKEGHKVRVLARNEHGHEQLQAQVPQGQLPLLSCLIGPVEDRERVCRAISGVDFLIHAAAQKIVPLAEYNPWQCIQTNVIGTRNVVEACLDAPSIKKAVLVSSDKARAPSTLYGATKLCAERLWLCANRYRGGLPGLFVGACYGNVFGSRGSVLHSFTQQAQYGYLQLTDSRMTRFHMTLNQAVDFVLRVLHEGDPGTLWIPRLPSYRLPDLADAFSKVYKLQKEPCFVGQRPAEKLHESLVSENESHSVKCEDDSHFVLEPGKVHENGGWSFNSNSQHTRRMSVEELEGEVREWAGT